MRTFSPRLALKALWQMRVRRRPFVLSHGINASCNLKCSFCEYWRSPSKEMSTPEIFRMLDDAKNFGIGVYNAWTVEPLLRQDLPQILGHAKSLGLITSLVTNGTLLKKRVHELTDLDYLSVSLDGIESYRDIRNANYNEVLEGIIAAKDAGHEILINCVINGKNLHELEALVRLAESLGIWSSFEPINESVGIEDCVWEELGIRDICEYENAIDRLIELKKKGMPIINSTTYLQMIKSLKPEFRCHASDIILHVTSDGSIENCRVHKEPLGNVANGISNIWEISLDARKRKVIDCKGCLFFGYVENSLLYEFVPEVMAHYEWV
ncbi:MAG: radical SAM protein [Methanotrichaceae archaeon]